MMIKRQNIITILLLTGILVCNAGVQNCGAQLETADGAPYLQNKTYMYAYVSCSMLICAKNTLTA